jgi:hypothetical protein
MPSWLKLPLQPRAQASLASPLGDRLLVLSTAGQPVELALGHDLAD